MEEFGPTYGPVVFPRIGFSRKNIVFTLLSVFYFVVLDCEIIIFVIIFIRLTTQRDKVCV